MIPSVHDFPCSSSITHDPPPTNETRQTGEAGKEGAGSRKQEAGSRKQEAGRQPCAAVRWRSPFLPVTQAHGDVGVPLAENEVGLVDRRLENGPSGVQSLDCQLAFLAHVRRMARGTDDLHRDSGLDQTSCPDLAVVPLSRRAPLCRWTLFDGLPAMPRNAQRGIN